MADKFKIRKGTKDNYDSLLEPDENTVYITTDTHEIFLGSNKLNDFNLIAGTGINITDNTISTVSLVINDYTK